MIKKITNIAVLILLVTASVLKAQDGLSLKDDSEGKKLRLSNIVSDETFVLDTLPTQSEYELLSSGYDYVNNRQYNAAISVFNEYLKTKPNDSKIHLQLGYLYDATRNYEKAYNSFIKVLENTDDQDQIDKARISMYYMRDLMVRNAVASFELYFYNFYDTYYRNYVGNLIAHLNFKPTRGIYLGPYIDTYFDSRSTPEYILNDRYVEFGGFAKFNITDWMNFEVRAGYVREIDFKKNSFSFKPILTLGKRLGTASFYKASRSQNTENFYYDIYASALYDYKFKNVFATLLNREALQFMLGGYSYMEFYLKQELAVDTKKLDYNNYLDLGVGLAFKPNIQSFPVLFVEGLYRNFLVGSTGEYLQGDIKNIFTVRAGFLLYYNTKL